LPVASKTGTATNGTNATDLYNVAYTTKHTVLTWIADINKNEITTKIYSSVEPTEINKQILAKLYNNAPPPDFAIPEGVERCAYDLFELSENHNIIAPTSDLERYIAYDYFKVDNKPQIVSTEQMLNFSAKLDKSGCELSFNANCHREYTMYKCVDNNSTELCKIMDSGDRVTVKDTDIFKYETITYYILDENMEVIAETKVFPQDYLINTLNSSIKSGKKKWAV
ncbi:MAG: hypothetical protein MJ152_02650, partial [Clostridia bacterium]|nr:hypothetical protein [Clostridia bacterium]